MQRDPVAWRPVLLVAGSTSVLLAVFSARYGFHRDELYFLAAGHHLSAGYPDQPLLVPLLARIFGHSLWLLRTPSDVAAGSTVLIGALTARELGADRAEQVMAALLMATCGFLVGSGHLLSTATIDLTLQSLVVLLVLRTLRDARPRRWVALGAVVGVDLLVKDLVAITALGLAGGVLLAGPRQRLRDPWLPVALVIAAAIAAPGLHWQATHGWPQLDVDRSIAAGHSGSSVARPLLLPMVALQLGPPLLPSAVAGVRVLWRRERALLLGALLTLALVLVGGGKPYYVSGFFPLVLAAGAPATLRWWRRHRRLGLGLYAFGALTTVLIALPVLPLSVLPHTPVPAVDGDALETVGWPAFADTMSRAWRATGSSGDTVVLTGNYGEAGALVRYGPARGLPSGVVYSPHNAFWLWGPPPASTRAVLTVGLDADVLARAFRSCTVVAHIDDRVGIDNDEQDEPVRMCRGPTTSWRRLWDQLKDYG